MKEKSKLLTMTHDECQQYMYNTYPDFFQEKSLPMDQTCMCWGCEIGIGWFPILDDACRQLKRIQKSTGITVVWEQIKEKFGSARFYYRITNPYADTNNKINDVQHDWYEVISSVIERAERLTEHTCAECGEQYFHDPISLHGWIYDLCKDCFLKQRPDAKADLEKREACDDLNEKYAFYSRAFNENEWKEVELLITKVELRLENKQKEQNETR